MTIQQAATALFSQYRHQPWFISVGIEGEAGLILYVTKKPAESLPRAMGGQFPVRVVKTNKPKPAEEPR